MVIGSLTRRWFLKVSASALGAYSLSACAPPSRAQVANPQRGPTIQDVCERSETADWVDETGLCLSGGGYRAMLFHVGSLWRLYETGILAECTRITSVSGGSITAGMLALRWAELDVSAPKVKRFVDHVATPIRAMASETIDVPAFLEGALWFGNISSKVEKYYSKHLFGDATLQDLPDAPRFIILATNLQSGAAFRFSKPYVADYRVGVIPKPTLSLAKAVAASSAFPPFLSPTSLELTEGVMEPCENMDLHETPYTTRIELTDGGVYDNMGLEPLKNFRRVLISDAGGKTQPERDPANDWARHSYRVLDLIDNQVRSLRKREMIRDHELRLRTVAYWSTRVDIDEFNTQHRTDLSKEYRDRLAAVPTRLKALPDDIQKGLINWGYVACDATVREFFKNDLRLPASLPYA